MPDPAMSAKKEPNDRATDEQLNALVDAYGGKLGGPLADLAGLVGSPGMRAQLSC
jgi:hypothetical protein